MFGMGVDRDRSGEGLGDHLRNEGDARRAADEHDPLDLVGFTPG